VSAGSGRAELPGDRWADPPPDGPEALAEERLLAAFERRATAANLDRVVRVAALLERGETGTLDEAGRPEAESLAHQVVGSAGTFGHPAASLDAARLERFFGSGAPVHERPWEERERARATLDRLTAELGG